MLPADLPHQPQQGAQDSLRIELLGIPRVSWNGVPLALVRRQARAVFFYLAYAAVPTGREVLADLLWPEKEPAAARRNLVRLLSTLRGELPRRELLLADGTAVWLDPAQFICDAHEFKRLARSGSSGDWETAAALYRGAFLSGFALSGSHTFDDWVQSAGYELERQYLEVLRKLVQEFIGHGETAKAIDYANQYLASDELAEEMHRALIKLYAAVGRRTDALQQYSRCVQILHHELGVEPLPETRAAFEAARDGALPSPPRSRSKPQWSTLPGLELPLTGREDVWRELEQAYQLRQKGGAILISGAPGNGKSRLMQEFASQQANLILVGNCHSGSLALPFQPLVQALRQALQNGQLTERLKGVWLAELSLLMPELRDWVPDLPAPLQLTAEQAQTRLFEALVQAFRSLAAGPGLLLCLDDLHAADEATLGWLAYATGQLPNSHICMIVTFRAQEAAQLSAWQRALSRSGLGSMLRLHALPHDSVAKLLVRAEVNEDVAAILAPHLHRATGGNAFFLIETMRTLLESSDLLSPSLTVPLPATVREAVLRRAERLDPLARQILDMAAILSPFLEGRLLAQASARSELEVVDALDKLVVRQFLVPKDNLFRFQHDLTQEAVYGAISEWRLRLLHRRAAQVLEQAMPSTRQNPLGAIARHYEQAGDLAQAIDGYHKASSAARHVYAHQEAIGYLRRAIDRLPEIEPSEANQVPALYESLADLLLLIGDYEGARAALAQNLDASASLRHVDRSRLYYKLGRTYSSQQRFEEAENCYADAETTLREDDSREAPERLQQWIDIKLSQADLNYLRNSWDELSALCDQLREPVAKNGSLRQQAEFYTTLGMLDHRKSRYTPSQATVAFTRQTLAIAEQLGDKILITHKTFSLGFQLLWSGDLDQAQELLSKTFAQAKEIDVLGLQNRAITYLTITCRLQGNEKMVRELTPKALRSTRKEGAKMYIGVAQANLAWLEYRRGRVDQSLNHAQAALQNWSNVAYPFEWLARFILLEISLHQHDLDAAVAQAKRMTDADQQRLPDPINDRFIQASKAAYGTEGQGAVAATLRQAISLAKTMGYL